MSKFNKRNNLEEVLELYKVHRSSEKVAKIVSDKYNLKFNSSLGRKIRSWVATVKKATDGTKIEESEAFKNALDKKIDESKYYIITSAQNATPVNKRLLTAIEGYADHLGAEIIAIASRYKNPTSIFSDSDYDWWDEKIHNYLLANRQNIHKSLTILGDVKVPPTASMPLTGFEGMTGLESSIIGHPRQHLKTIPTVGDLQPKFLLSTGSITKPNYTDSKAGKKGEFHHTYGFVIVEIRDKEIFHVRQVSANNNGTFYDLDIKVTPDGVFEGQDCVEAVTLGDIHLGHHDPVAIKSSIKMLNRFKPKNVLLHDIMDGASISHHEKNDPFIALGREQDGSWDLTKELSEVVKFVDTIKQFGPVIVKSNHDIFVDRWLLSNDWRKEKNKYAYLKYAKLKADGELPNGILPYEMKLAFGDKVKCLTEDESFKVKGNEMGIHGHMGANGSRGSAMQFKRLNTKLVTAHTHSPLKMDNLITVGTLTFLRVGYNKGLSGWYHANAITHVNGKTQLLLMNQGKYYTTL